MVESLLDIVESRPARAAAFGDCQDFSKIAELGYGCWGRRFELSTLTWISLSIVLLQVLPADFHPYVRAAGCDLSVRLEWL